MKKVQILLKSTRCLMNSSLSFIGKESLNFLTDDFYLLFGKRSEVVGKSLLSPYFKPKNHPDFLKDLKTKSPILIKNRAFQELADGFEPPTG